MSPVGASSFNLISSASSLYIYPTSGCSNAASSSFHEGWEERSHNDSISVKYDSGSWLLASIDFSSSLLIPSSTPRLYHFSRASKMVVCTSRMSVEARKTAVWSPIIVAYHAHFRPHFIYRMTHACKWDQDSKDNNKVFFPRSCIYKFQFSAQFADCIVYACSWHPSRLLATESQNTT